MWTNDTGGDLCLNADKSQVVPCDSSDAAFLLVGPGGQVSDEDAERYGLSGKGKAKAEPAEAPAEVEAEAEPEEKAAPKAADKAVKSAPENKAKRG